MKKKLLITTLLSLNVFSAFAIDWETPSVLCPEEILPKGIPCPDFSKLDNVYSDFPSNWTEAEIKLWKTTRGADLRYCRNSEVLRREKLKTGTYSKATVENAWMVVNGGEKVQEKLDSIQAASLKYQIPPQVLMGAMRQESLLSSLGVSPDGGNYSCGMSQLNIEEWCNAMNSLTVDEKNNLGWPVGIKCENDLPSTDIVKPFYDIAVKNLGTRATYELNAADFKGITFDQVAAGLPKGSDEQQQTRFKAISSFVNHCQDVNLSINFKAKTLRSLFMNFVPKELREKNTYREGQTFTRQCKAPYVTTAYPLHTGWLLAVAMYNAGPRQKDVLDHYFQIKDNNYSSLTPLDLIEALHWGGKYKKRSDLLEFKTQAGDKFTQTWFKSCIVQRHVARVIQHVTSGPNESIAKSLEEAPCKPNDGVPSYRQKGTGIK